MRVTVLMPVYNGEKYLKDAIDSILAQTFKDFEFLIIDDGSTDTSAEIIKSYDDERIRFVQNESNLKLIKTLNNGLRLANGEYIARMDCDDISFPERIQRQVEFMDENLEVGICGTWSETIGDGVNKWETRFPCSNELIKAHLLINTALSHPTVIFRKSLLEKHDLSYNEEAEHAEDYDLWVRASELFDLANIPEVLLSYRVHKNQVSAENSSMQKATADKTRKILLSKLALSFNDEQMKMFGLFCEGFLMEDLKFFQEVGCMLSLISRNNAKKNIFSLVALRRIFFTRWASLCLKNGLKPNIFFHNEMFSFSDLIKMLIMQNYYKN